MGWLWGCEGIRDKTYQFMLFTQTLAPKLNKHTTYISAHNPERVQTPQPPPRTAMVSPKAITRCEKHASTCAPPVASRFRSCICANKPIRERLDAFLNYVLTKQSFSCKGRFSPPNCRCDGRTFTHIRAWAASSHLHGFCISLAYQNLPLVVE